MQLNFGMMFAFCGGLAGESRRVLPLATQRAAFSALREDFLEHFGRLASGNLGLFRLRVLQFVNLLLERYQSNPLLGVMLQHLGDQSFQWEGVVDAAQPVDQRVVVHDCAVVVVVAVHGLKGHHFEEEHSDGEDVCLGGDVGVEVEFL